MDITWLGHSCFRLRGRDVTVITDPYQPDNGFPALKQTAQIVTVSHSEHWHNASDLIGGSPWVVDGPGEYEIANVPIVGIRTYQDAEKGAKRGKNLAVVIHIEDVAIAHLGNLGHALTADQASQFGNVDVLLIPVGGKVTIDAVAASEMISQLQPSIVIPMHYKTGSEQEDLEPIDRFIKEMGLPSADAAPRLTVTRSSVPDTITVQILSAP